MTHENLPRVCTPEEFLAAEPRERLRLAFQQIVEHPELWNQWEWVVTDDDWDGRVLMLSPRHLNEHETRRLIENTRNVNLCGTAYCLGGWGCVLAGDRFISVGAVITRDEHARDVSWRGEELFGIHEETAGYLFDQDRHLADLQAAVEWLTEDPRHEIVDGERVVLHGN